MRFTIRDWLTLLAAVLVAWWVDRRALSRRIDELKSNQVILGGVTPRIIIQPDEESALGISLDAERRGLMRRDEALKNQSHR
jgi:hypothetical protein